MTGFASDLPVGVVPMQLVLTKWCAVVGYTGVPETAAVRCSQLALLTAHDRPGQGVIVAQHIGLAAVSCAVVCRQAP